MLYEFHYCFVSVWSPLALNRSKFHFGKTTRMYVCTIRKKKKLIALKYIKTCFWFSLHPFLEQEKIFSWLKKNIVILYPYYFHYNTIFHQISILDWGKTKRKTENSTKQKCSWVLAIKYFYFLSRFFLKKAIPKSKFLITTKIIARWEVGRLRSNIKTFFGETFARIKKPVFNFHYFCGSTYLKFKAYPILCIITALKLYTCYS